MNDHTKLADRVLSLLRPLAERLLEGRPATVDQAEEAGREFARAASEAMLASIAEQWGTGYCGPLHKDEKGVLRAFHRHGEREVTTLAGPLKLRRAYYRDTQGGGEGLFPLDAQIGLGSSSMSRELEEIVAEYGATLSFERTTRLFERALRLAISPQTARRVTEKLGQELLDQENRDVAAFLGSKPPAVEHACERVAVTVDGTMAHVGGEWREAKVGAIYHFDEEGEQIDGRKRFVGRFGTPQDLAGPLSLEAWRMGAYEARVLTFLGDGAPWIWNLGAELFPQAISILDFYHGLEHVGEVANVRFAKKAAARAWKNMVKARLKNDGIDWLIAQIDKASAAAGVPPKGCSDDDPRAVLARNLDYFTTNRDRMLYGTFRRMGLPIGSGVVEAGGKTVVQHRMKAAGMRWGARGADALLAARTATEGNVFRPRLHELRPLRAVA